MPLLEADPYTDQARLARRKHRGGVLVPIDPSLCPACGQTTDTLVIGEPALFLHGGYGATRTTTTRHCRCGWTLIVDVTETNPRRP
jgi:hypothetical protein